MYNLINDRKVFVERHEEAAHGPKFGVTGAYDAKGIRIHVVREIKGRKVSLPAYNPVCADHVSPRVLTYGEAFAHATTMANVGG